jgi:2-dehydro-3-deoxyphosphogluconate aldolase/(4S)-4-hydroxy-2-oxoglutarate aldolase
MTTTVHTRPLVSQSLQRAPIIGVVRTPSREEAARRARLFAASGIELVEVTFSVPGASGLVRELLAERTSDGPPWFGMGTVTTAARAREAVAAGAEFIVTPNVSVEVTREARQADVFLVMGALTATEIVTAPAVGGPAYLEAVRGPLSDIPMLAAGGFGVDEIAAYARAGATAFGIGAPLLGGDDEETRRVIARGLEQARGAIRQTGHEEVR